MRIIFLILCLLPDLFVNAQCNTDKLSNDCINALSSGFNFLKTYKLESDKDAVEYSYVFTKGTSYMITLCTETKGVTITLFDSGRNKVASNSAESQITNGLIYSCGATGIFYIKFSFRQPGAGCVASALGFKR